MKTIKRDLFTNDFDFVEEMKYIYECCSCKDYILKNKEYIFNNYLQLVTKHIYDINIEYNKRKTTPVEYTPREDKTIILLFSGGKDSIASALKLKNEGWNVILFFIKGINFGYDNEIKYAKKFALENNFELYIEEIEINGTQDFLENPVKNQLILSMAVQYGIKLGITNYSYGGFIEDTISTSAFDRNFSDSAECFDEFLKDIKLIIPEIKIHRCFKNETESLEYISNFDVDYISCITPYRYHEKLNKENSEKYNINLSKNNCGSCWKCCLEYIVKADNGKVEYNKAFYHHCLDILRKKQPEERPYVKNIKSLHDIYVEYLQKDNKPDFFETKDNIRLATLDDFDYIKKLRENDVLGRMFYETVKDEILSGDMYVCEKDNKIVAFCSMMRYAKSKKIEIDGLVVDKKYRRQGIAQSLINRVLEYNIDVYAQAVKNAENNYFYDKIGVCVKEYTSKSGNLYLKDYLIKKGDEK